MKVLVINCGSSSVKYKIINVVNEKVVSQGRVEGIGLDSCVFKQNGSSKKVFVKNHDAALALILKNLDVSKIDVVGHRFVHGGSLYDSSVVLSPSVLKDLESLKDLAPLHNPHNLAGIKACVKLLDVPQVVVFDTSFYKDLPLKASTYALPFDFVQKHGLKKYGFHGISHKFLNRVACEFLGRDKVNVITCHLGNGASVSCIKHNVCIDTSMGFTPLQGLVMGSRSGDLDPGLVLYLQDKLRLSVGKVQTMLNKESGLKGLCGESDMRSVYKKVLDNDDRASLALDVFCHRLVHYIGAYLAIMDADTHAIVFSAGVGEGGFFVRKRVCNSLKHLGVVINFDKNMINDGQIVEPTIISDESSKIKILVIPTDEELMIALESVMMIKEN